VGSVGIVSAAGVSGAGVRGGGVSGGGVSGAGAREDALMGDAVKAAAGPVRAAGGSSAVMDPPERPGLAADSGGPLVRAPDPAPRVALFLPNLGGGGAERVMLNLARGLLDAGYAVDVTLAAAEGSYLERVPGGAEVVDLHAARTLAALPALTRYLRRRRPDAVVSALSHANVVAVWAARLAGFEGRVLVAEHSHPGLAPARRGDGLRRALQRRAYLRAGGVVAVSKGVKDAWVERLGLPEGAVEVIYNPVVTPETRRAMAQPPAHPFFGSPPVVVGVGRLSREKNFANLLRAFARLRVSTGARLIVLGEGPERPALERLAAELGVADAVSLPGFQDNPHAFLARADLFVLSSDHEGLPTALIEALAAGTPVVSTDCPVGPREILAGGARGALVPPGDSGALADAMREALSHGRPPVDPAWLEPFTLERATARYVHAMGVATS